MRQRPDAKCIFIYALKKKILNDHFNISYTYLRTTFVNLLRVTSILFFKNRYKVKIK